MFDFFRKKKPTQETPIIEKSQETQKETNEEDSAQKRGFFSFFRKDKKEPSVEPPLKEEETPSPTLTPEPELFSLEALLSQQEAVETSPASAQTPQEPPSPAGPLELVTEPEAAAPDPMPEPEAPAPEPIPEPEAPAPDPIPEQEAQAPAPLPEPEAPAPDPIPEPEAQDPIMDEEPPEETEKKGFFARLKDKLSSTRKMIAGRIESIFASTRSIDDTVLEELEEILFTSDLGVNTTMELLKNVKTKVARKELKDANALKLALRDSIVDMMDIPQKDLVPEKPPRVILMVGVNGVGKTTTIAKLARTFTSRGQKVLLAAGDTFRAAAVEQLQIWAERLKVDCVAQKTGSDAAAVVFDALSAAKARKSDVVIIDTAGRLHTKSNLMEELKKIKRVAGKSLPGAPHETILVLDGNTGQNAARQAQTFNEEVGIDSIIVTKLDGTSKGGVVVSIIHDLKIPIIFIGIGEKFSDLKPFDPVAYANAILGVDDQDESK
ncbi:MAG: signal recognition particle-docking protein FtsY [Deltaproteobacteria bacterium]|jgi:fused signal recognition particle receptor|nr:signal recognition particle-docking protein FtsY [Deltaproteobacteria bacterium]